MTTKEKLAILLEEKDGAFLSGNAIAESLGITRAAVWKNIKQLEQEGYQIEAVTNRGYRLLPMNDAISESAVRSFLGDKNDLFTLDVRDSVTSTNSLLKEMAPELPDWYVMIARNQTAGRGRVGRSFFSPYDTGIYLSVLLKPDISVSDAGKLTTASAVAACRAIESSTEAKAQIKWVNDVFVNGGKVCGILTEASVNFETGKPDWIVTGIGFNVYPPKGGFPKELQKVAGVITEKAEKNLRAKLAAEYIRNFYEICGRLSETQFYQEYKERCFILGQLINVIKGEETIPARALDILEDFSLLVQYQDGREEALAAGEVSIRPGSSET